VTVGEVMLDVLGPEAAGGTTHAPVTVRPGGTPLTAALAAHAAGASAMLVGRVGDDAAAAAIRAGLANAGVEAFLAVDDELPTGTFVQLGETIVASRGANAHLRAGDIPALTADAVLVSGYLLAHDDTLEAGQRALASEAPLRAVIATPRCPEDFVDRAAGANVLFATAAEAERLGGETALAARFEILCVTFAAEGAVLYRDGTAERLPPTGRSGTGAGDALAGSLLARR
jgi:sugar/nucleoside kinase (ribokinase family)